MNTLLIVLVIFVIRWMLNDFIADATGRKIASAIGIVLVLFFAFVFHVNVR